jgi:hypothetical protein
VREVLESENGRSVGRMGEVWRLKGGWIKEVVPGVWGCRVKVNDVYDRVLVARCVGAKEMDVRSEIDIILVCYCSSR